MPTLLITGGAGFIGSSFTNMVLLNKLPEFVDWRVIVVDALTYAGDRSRISHVNMNKRLDFIQGNITDVTLINDLVQKVDGIVNFAAETHVDRSISNPSIFLQSNLVGVGTLLDAIRNSDIRFLQISTDEVYGSISEGFATEETKLNPSSPYSASKASADLLVLSYYKTFNTNIIITRCSNNYGLNQFPEKLIPFFIKLLKSGKQVPIYGSGLNSRDWIHVEDHCRAISTAFKLGTSGEIYNIGDVEHFSNLEVAKMILKSLNLPLERIDFVDDRPGHDFRYAISATKIVSQFGWQPTENLLKTIESLILED